MNIDVQSVARRPFLDRPGTAFAWALGLMVLYMGLSLVYQDSFYLDIAIKSFLLCIPAFSLFAFTHVYSDLDRDVQAETLKKPHWIKQIQVIVLYVAGLYSLMFGLFYVAAASLVWFMPQTFLRENKAWAIVLYLTGVILLILRTPLNVVCRKTGIQLAIVFLLPFWVKVLFYPCKHLACWIEGPLLAALSNIGVFLFAKLTARFARHWIIRTNWSDNRYSQRFNRFFIQLLPE